MQRTAVFAGTSFIGTNLVLRLMQEGRPLEIFDDFSLHGGLRNLMKIGAEEYGNVFRCNLTDEASTSIAVNSMAAENVFIVLNCRPVGFPFNADRLRLPLLALWRKAERSGEYPQNIYVLISRTEFSEPPSAETLSKIHEIVQEYRSKGLSITTFTFPAAYGPFQNPTGFIPTTVWQALEGEPIVLKRPGQKISHLVPVHEIIQAALLIEEKGKKGRDYSLVIPKLDMTEREATHFICRTLDHSKPLPFGRYETLIIEAESSLDPKANTPCHDLRFPETRDIIKMGFSPSQSVEEHLTHSIHWFVQNWNWLGKARLTSGGAPSLFED